MKEFFLLILVLVFSVSVQAQTQRKKLEAKRLEIQREIESINRSLSQVDKKKLSALDELNQINRKLLLRQKLITNLRREINSISHEITLFRKQITKSEKELQQLKNNYASLIRQSYKNRSRNGKLFFLFSSNDFQQAFKRMQYLKQYSNFRKEQGLEIEKNKKKLVKLKENLEKNRASKQKLFLNYKKEQDKIKKEQKQQLSVVEEIKKKRNFYIKKIKAKEKQKRKLDRLIEAEISKAIAKSNKKSGSKYHKNRKTNKFFLTPEGVKLANAFSANRGILPWPVKKAYISLHFGVQKNKIFKKLKTQNSGINLSTVKGEKVRVVFKGKVLQIQFIPGGNITVFIKHGNYLTIYQNLIDVRVKPGDKVKTKQVIGKVATDPTTGKTEMKFMIFKNLTKLNPEKWLLKK